MMNKYSKQMLWNYFYLLRVRMFNIFTMKSSSILRKFPYNLWDRIFWIFMGLTNHSSVLKQLLFKLCWVWEKFSKIFSEADIFTAYILYTFEGEFRTKHLLLFYEYLIGSRKMNNSFEFRYTWLFWFRIVLEDECFGIQQKII